MKFLVRAVIIFLSATMINGCKSTKSSVHSETINYPDGESQYQPYAPDGIPFVIAKLPWKADMQGNHRATVFAENSKAVLAELPWRRPDVRPETKKVIVVDSATNTIIKNVLVKELTSEKGVIVFEPLTVPGNYYIYYLPYKFRKGWDDARYGKPWNDYLPPVYEEDRAWVTSLPEQISTIPKATVLRFESRTRFDFFTPMGTIATRKEMDSLGDKFSPHPLIFPEDRAFPIRLSNQIPARWVKTGPAEKFTGMAMKNEYYVWQLGVWAAHK